MGYEVDVSGTIRFVNVKGFIKNFPHPKSGEDDVNTAFNYFFTKVWGNSLEELKTVSDGEVLDFFRDGKNWYDVGEAMKYLSKYATFTLEFQGEDRDDRYKYVSEDGVLKLFFARISWREDKNGWRKG